MDDGSGSGSADRGPSTGVGAGAGAGERRRRIDLPVVVVSACLLGVRCNHEGGASPSEAVRDLARDHRLVPVCPETAGGLSTPRPAAELQSDGRVVTVAGEDVTDAYRRGADRTVRLARSLGAKQAVLKARSPSCGCHEVYDGTFSRTRVAGEGVTAAALRAAGVEVCSEEDVEAAGSTGG